VLAMATSPSRTFSARSFSLSEDGFGEVPKPAREARALPRAEAFTLIELLIVMAIIIILGGLVLGIAGYAHEKGARSRAEAEIAAMSAALESYKADNGIYPANSDTTSLDPATTTPDSYKPASQYLYISLAGDSDGDPTKLSAGDTKNYFGSALKPSMLSPNPPGPNTFIRDPFGNSYGYSTAKASAPASTVGYNPTYDLWSTGGETGTSTAKWIKNW